MTKVNDLTIIIIRVHLESEANKQTISETKNNLRNKKNNLTMISLRVQVERVGQTEPGSLLSTRLTQHRFRIIIMIMNMIIKMTIESMIKMMTILIKILDNHHIDHDNQ